MYFFYQSSHTQTNTLRLSSRKRATVLVKARHSREFPRNLLRRYSVGNTRRMTNIKFHSEITNYSYVNIKMLNSNWGLVGCGAVPLVECFPTFRNNAVPSYTLVKKSERIAKYQIFFHAQISCSFMYVICCRRRFRPDAINIAKKINNIMW